MKKLAFIAFALALLSSAALAQSFWPTPGNQTVGGAVQMCLNSSGQAQPCGTSGGTSGGQTPIQGNGTGTTGAVVGTLTSTAGHTAFICGFSVSSTGTGSIGPITVAGLLGGSQIYQLTAGQPTPLIVQYNPCLPASAVNTNITTTTTADASATAVDVNSWGYLF
jgi:hypothetical protein